MSERCCVCGKFLDMENSWCCEECGGVHHPKCSGYESDGYEYSNPSEEAYSICKNCTSPEPAKKGDE